MRLAPERPPDPQFAQPLLQFGLVDLGVGGARLLDLGAQRFRRLGPQCRMNPEFALAQAQFVALGIVVAKLGFVFLAGLFFFGGKPLLLLAQPFEFGHAGIHHGDPKLPEQFGLSSLRASACGEPAKLISMAGRCTCPGSTAMIDVSMVPCPSSARVLTCASASRGVCPDRRKCRDTIDNGDAARRRRRTPRPPPARNASKAAVKPFAAGGGSGGALEGRNIDARHFKALRSGNCRCPIAR